MAKRNRSPEDAEIDLILASKRQIEKAHEHYNEESELLLAKLSLPLADALGVPPEQEATKSQEILEKLVRLRQERDAAINAARQVLETHVHSFPQEEREEVRSRIQLTLDLS